MVRQYKHNDMVDLENLLREVVSQGQPRTHRPWKKILLVVEGLYSMEGTLVDLPTILDLKRKYKVRRPRAVPHLLTTTVLPLRRRGSLGGCARAERTRRVRLLWARPPRHRHPDGHLYEMYVCLVSRAMR